MKQDKDKKNIGSQTAKEREVLRQLFQGGFYFTITLVIIIAIILFFCSRY